MPTAPNVNVRYRDDSSDAIRMLFLMHTTVGASLLTNYVFDSEKPYRFCCICGAVYQCDVQRELTPDAPADRHAHAYQLRQVWAEAHAKTHTQAEHRQLRMSGRSVTPEAAERLVPFGIAPLTDMLVSDEHAHAGRQAPRHSPNNPEGSL